MFFYLFPTSIHNIYTISNFCISDGNFIRQYIFLICNVLQLTLGLWALWNVAVDLSGRPSMQLEFAVVHETLASAYACTYLHDSLAQSATRQHRHGCAPKNTRDASADGHGIPNDEIKSRYKFLEGTLLDAARDAIFENHRFTSSRLR